MLLNLFNEFINELKKEENKKQIINAINPYVNVYMAIFNFYVYILVSLFIILIVVQFFILYKIYNLSNF